MTGNYHGKLYIKGTAQIEVRNTMYLHFKWIVIVAESLDRGARMILESFKPLDEHTEMYRQYLSNAERLTQEFNQQ